LKKLILKINKIIKKYNLKKKNNKIL